MVRSVNSIEKESRKSTELKRWIVTEILWKGKRTSLSSHEIREILRPRSLRKSTVEKLSLNEPRFSTHIIIIIMVWTIYIDSSINITQKSPGFSFVHIQVEMCGDCACVKEQSEHLAANDVRKHHFVQFPVDISSVVVSNNRRLIPVNHRPHTTTRQCLRLFVNHHCHHYITALFIYTYKLQLIIRSIQAILWIIVIDRFTWI